MAQRASVIVRVKNEAATIGETLGRLGTQTVRPEIIVVDSGSTDGTLEIAAERSDLLLTIPSDEFSYGGALNLGARSASAPVLFALSAHCTPPDDGWIERSLSLYENDDVAATNGGTKLPDGSPVRGTFFQDGAFARAHPFWGFSNHASSWRRAAWDRFQFDETLEAGEDKEWALRILTNTAWLIAYRPDLMVPLDHRWKAGAVSFFRRSRIETRAMAQFAELPVYGLPELTREWWSNLPEDRHSAFAHRFLNRVRIAGLLGKYRGALDAREAERGTDR